MKQLLNTIKYRGSKIFLKFVISVIGLIRKYSDITTKNKIDTMVSESIIRHAKLTLES